MAFKYLDHVFFDVDGTPAGGNITVGAAKFGMRTPADAGYVDGDITIVDIKDGSAWEKSIVVFSITATVLARTLIESSTGSLLSLTSAATVEVTPLGFMMPGVRGADVACAATIVLGQGDYFHITGTTGPVTDIDFAVPNDGRKAILVWDAAASITHHATTLIIPGGSRTVGVGEVWEIVQDATDNIRVVLMTKADGTAVVLLAASETVAGVVELATTTEAATGTDISRAITAAGLRASTREKLTAARTYYVRTDGSDSNTGLADTAGGAWLTLQHAYDIIRATLDFAGNTVTVQVRAGTYTGGLAISTSWLGGGALFFTGDTSTPANVIISTTSANCIQVTAPLGGNLGFTGFQLKTTTSGSGIFVSSPGVLVTYNQIDFNTIVTTGIYVAAPGSSVQAVTNGTATISGGSTSHWQAEQGGQIQARGQTVTITGTPAFSFAFATANNAGIMFVDFETFSGSATGTRYIITGNSVLYTGGGGATYLPGNGAGSSSTGAQYL